MKKTKNKRKKNETNSRFFTFLDFSQMPKIGHFGGLRVGTTKNEKKRKKLEFFLRVLDFQKFAKRRAGKHQRRKKRKLKKNGKNNRKKTTKKTRFFTFLDFQKWVKNRPFWWAPRLSGGEGREPPKMETLGSLSLQEPLQGKVWGCQKLQNGIFGGNLSNFGDDFGDK